MSGSSDDIHPDAAVAPGYLANHAARVFNRIVDSRLKPLGMSLGLLGPILLLRWKGAMPQRDLVRHAAVKQPAMVALLDKLEAMELIARSPVPGDKRSAMIALTPQGDAIADAGRDALLAANVAGVEGFSAEEAELLVSLLQRFIIHLEASQGT
ncbi:Transcriptional regulator SlyA [Sphingomonas sp. S2M10]|uniref:MarR family winged helix-turn-helix transcriptional regulator n=1 Tax=Sphingomonas sp. S2M10 TaxID=2705010 RepID=UPI001457184A|nr:MarR family transcriptional regulator [Sphingomonas sp. S2M10]NLS29101.1 Transcriptional regulator SlyA [Sphingomonas sp. S2M10]